MKKLFILQEKNSPYQKELEAARRMLKEKQKAVKLEDLDADYLNRNAIEIVISNGLPVETYYLLKGMNIVTVTLDDLAKHYNYADIVIDCRSEDSNKYFTGPKCSLPGETDLDFVEVVKLIKKLDWDSAYFGFNVAFLSCMHLTENIYSRIDKFIRKENIRLVEYLCNCHDKRSVKVAEKNGFHFADIRLTFSKQLRDNQPVKLPAGVFFKRAKRKDISTLKKVSSGIYKDSRYFFDDNFDPRKAQEFYQGWVEKGVLGKFDDECWSLYDGKTPFAFCTVKYRAGNSASIGLFGMAEKYQGRGLGKQLLFLVFNMLLKKGISNLSVVTQGRNYAAQRLYQSVGFKTKTTQLWYHKWI